jgi:Kef-type K+ transport system membrane component KefB
LYQCKALLEQWNLRMRPFVNIVLVPVFFFYTGMKVELGSMVTAQDILWCLAWVLCACLSKGLSCTLAARLAGFSMTDSLRIGTLLNTRALMELVVLNIAHSLGLMPPQLFSILVIMALVSTLITSPLLNAIQKYSGRSVSAQPVGQYS